MENPNSKEISIALSSWPGSGSTSFAYIFAFLLKRKYLYVGDVFRYLGEKLGYSGKERNESDSYIENIIGHTMDNYVDYKLLNEHNLILEGDVSAFRLGKNPNIFSIFILASREERLRRIQLDNRPEGENELDTRDKMLADKYKQLWDIEWFSKEYIATRYNLIIDNSNMTIEAEIIMALTEMNKYHKFNEQFNISELKTTIENEVKKFWEIGKKGYKEKLVKKKLFYTPEEIIREITQEFPEDIVKFPNDLQSIFLGRN